MSEGHTFVVVGAGLAGAKAVETLRAEGFDGRLVLVGEEPVRPYERPPLSKEYLQGNTEQDTVFVHDTGFYAANRIELRTASQARAVDPAGRIVELSSGERLSYDALLLATGAAPRRLAVPGADLDGVHYLRDLSDADRLRAGLRAGARVVVIGAGWIGCEVAASARQRGCQVDVVEVAGLPLQRVLGVQLGQFYADVHAAAGVRLHLGVGVDSLRGAGKVEDVRLADGTVLPADVVVVGVGVTPRTELAETAGLGVQNGVVTDEHLAASAPAVFAAGDVANAWHPLFGRRIRLEHWSAALHQGPTAAKNMLGLPTAYQQIPYFYSDQYDVGMEYTGLPTDFDELLFRGDPAGREFIAFWLKADRVVAGMNVNVWDVADTISALITSGHPVDRARLLDPSTDLQALLPPTAAAEREQTG